MVFAPDVSYCYCVWIFPLVIGLLGFNNFPFYCVWNFCLCCEWFGYDGLGVLLPGFGLLEGCVCFLCFERVSVVVWVA